MECRCRVDRLALRRERGATVARSLSYPPLLNTIYPKEKPLKSTTSKSNTNQNTYDLGDELNFGQLNRKNTLYL
jgi:hypothetical protein